MSKAATAAELNWTEYGGAPPDRYFIMQGQIRNHPPLPGVTRTFVLCSGTPLGLGFVTSGSDESYISSLQCADDSPDVEWTSAYGSQIKNYPDVAMESVVDPITTVRDYIVDL